MDEDDGLACAAGAGGVAVEARAADVDELTAHKDVVFHQAAIRITQCAEEPRLALEVLVDGTFWQEDEMASVGLGDRKAADMGHLPQSGPGGMMEVLRPMRKPRKILIHINNTNPILDENSPERQAFVRGWLLRQKDLVEKYRPDLVYFDDYGLPFGQTGIDAVAHYYALSRDAVVTAKRLSSLQRRAIVEDVERGFVAGIQPQPWQTDTCIGNWHYDRPLYERGGYKTAKQVVQRLCDVVSKNGNLLLSIPQRGDGSIDEKEEAILDQLATWFAVNGKAVYGTRPWRVFGEGPTRPPTGMQNEGEAKPFVAEDIRFTSGRGALIMNPPSAWAVAKRDAPDIASLWSILDLTPAGRGTDWYPKLSYG